MRNPKSILLATILVFTFSFEASGSAFRLNFLGYNPNSPKQIAIANPTGAALDLYFNASFQQTLNAGPEQIWDASGEAIRLIDLSHLTTPGYYYLMQGPSMSNYLIITESPYDSLLDGLTRYFYYQRSSTPITPTNGGVWARNSGPAPGYDYAGFSEVPNEYVGGEFPGGWFDGYDYSKYMPSTLFSIQHLLNTWQNFPTLFESRSLNLPESGNGIPDILDEARWGLNWVMLMQSPIDGAAYHRMTPYHFPGVLMPYDDDANRFVVNKSATASFGLAAVLAQASKVYRTYDSEFADSCLAKAVRAYQWGVSNSGAYAFPNAGSFRTKEYLDNNSNDEHFMASVYLAIATQGAESYYIDQAILSYEDLMIPTWTDVNALGCFAALTQSSNIPQLASICESGVLKLADSLVLKANNNGFGIALNSNEFIRQSNALLSGIGNVLVYAYYLTQDETYFKAAQTHFDYVLGRNALGISFVTGFSFNYPAHPAHPTSEADGVVPPVPGIVVSGPNLGLEDVPGSCPSSYSTGFAATTWNDSFCSFATNESGIHLNASMLYLTASLTSIAQGIIPEGPVITPMPVAIPKKNTKYQSVDILGRKILSPSNYSPFYIPNSSVNLQQ
jgi:endoglucanase